MPLVGLFRSAWEYRHFIWSTVYAEHKGKYATSKLGWLWMVIQPLAHAAVLAIVLSKILSAKLPGINSPYAYAIYLLAGMLGWALFNEVLSRMVTLFTSQGNLIKKINFPRICLPVITSLSASVNHLALFFCTLLIYFLMQHFPLANLGWLLMVFAVNLLLASSLGIILGVLNVFIRDISQLIPVVLQFWFWLTPIVYTADILPEEFQVILAANPVYPIVQGYQSILAFNQTPDIVSILLIGIGSLFVAIAALFLFRRASSEIVDQL